MESIFPDGRGLFQQHNTPLLLCKNGSGFKEHNSMFVVDKASKFPGQTGLIHEGPTLKSIDL